MGEQQTPFEGHWYSVSVSPHDVPALTQTPPISVQLLSCVFELPQAASAMVRSPRLKAVPIRFRVGGGLSPKVHAACNEAVIARAHAIERVSARLPDVSLRHPPLPARSGNPECAAMKRTPLVLTSLVFGVAIACGTSSAVSNQSLPDGSVSSGLDASTLGDGSLTDEATTDASVSDAPFATIDEERIRQALTQAKTPARSRRRFSMSS